MPEPILIDTTVFVWDPDQDRYVVYQDRCLGPVLVLLVLLSVFSALGAVFLLLSL